MTAQDLMDRYQIGEEELAGLIRENLKKITPGTDYAASAENVTEPNDAALKKLDALIGRTPMPEPSDTMEPAVAKLRETISALEQEKAELESRLKQKQVEYTGLQHEYLTAKSESSAMTANLLSDIEREKKKAEELIARMKERHESEQHFTTVRIEELETRNAGLQSRLESVHEELRQRTDELAKSRQENQELTNMANQKCAKAALELLDAQHSRDNLKGILHQKELQIAGLEEDKHQLLDKHRAAQATIGEILMKVQAAREAIYKVGSDFDDYFSKPEDSEGTSTGTDEAVNTLKFPPAPDAAIEVFGEPVSGTAAGETDTKPGLWRRVASLF